METPRTIADLPNGGHARIAEVREPGILGERLLEMGLTPGTRVHVIRRGIFGQVMQLSVRNYMLSLRTNQARNILVEV